ncbi:SGNH hydrolase domain-containing protein [Alloyangia mangrovi]|uniref:SGNH hydrolase domain-containing protein n=1 Tax=Alloyangia mangrovi TaxID=1779329 RepID=UPI00288BC97B|nr:SGNH hydrolase domain-containing protein [Alloyangia mangrovi]
MGPWSSSCASPPRSPITTAAAPRARPPHAGWPLAPAPVTDPDMPRGTLAQRVAEAEAPWRAMAEAGEITLIDSWPRFCDAGACHALHDSEGWYFDNNHITNTAARALRDLFVPIFGTKVAGL